MDFNELASRLATERVDGRIRTAGEIRHIKDEGPAKRKFIKKHTYKAKDLKQLTKILWQISVALGHLSSATNTFTRVKSVNISPDGMLGGSGYSKKVKDVRKDLYSAVEALSAIQDCLHDEVNAAHWKPELMDLPPKEQEDVAEMLDDVERVREDPAGFGEEAYEDQIEEDDEDEEGEYDLLPVTDGEDDEEGAA